MALNPFFLQGSQSEQRLIQELINEQLTIYGVEVVYLPRKIVKQDNILNEIESSKFSDNYAIEAYVNTYDGYGGAGDIMTKFGISLKDELTITISKERFEDFISPFLGSLNENNDDEINVFTRPREGDLIYFPLGKRFFEVKFVEHEQPFYQLGKNYVYQLKCELFELEDELGGWDQVSTSNSEIDELVESVGYLTSLRLIGIGTTASVGLITSTGYVRNITLTNDGSGYTKVPTVSISTAPSGGTNATAVAITTSINNIFSVKEILITNAGAGYTVTPTVNIISAVEDIVGVGTTTHGVGAAATATLVTNSAGVREVYSFGNGGSGYTITPAVNFTLPVGPGAEATASISGLGTVNGVTVTDGGQFYNQTEPPIVTFSDAPAGVVNAGSISTAGAGHVNGANYNTTGGSGTGFRIQGQGSGGMIGFTILAGGQGYVVGDIVATVNSYPAYIEITGVTTHTTASGVGNVNSAGIVTSVTISNAGTGYTTAPTVSIANTSGNKTYGGGLNAATGKVVVSAAGTITAVRITDAGTGYDSSTATATIEDPQIIVGVGTFKFNEVVTGSRSGAKGRVKSWDGSKDVLQLGTTDGTFVKGDTVTGEDSGAKYVVNVVESPGFNDKYDKGDEIETEADTILDFTESNPFGTY